MWRRLTGLLLSLALSGCASLERVPYSQAKDVYAQPPGFEQVMRAPQDPALPQDLLNDLRLQLNQNPKSELSALTLSGGGADGAFGAGVLVGWTKHGDRPEFQVVTGVSTGALIAPFAFLGSDYDERLRQAYTSGLASKILKRKGFSALISPGVFSSENLEKLVAYFVDMPLVEAIATEHDKGRRLIVATTNLDNQTGVIWDIGAIASQGVAKKTEAGKLSARDLIRKVLVASASVPGAFAPVLITTQATDASGQTEMQEMHADGSVTMPFFVLPESMINWQMPPDLVGRGHVYVLINGNITPHFALTPYKPVDVAARSLDTLTRAQARTTLQGIKGFAERNRLGFSVVAIPDDYTSAGLMGFDKPSMQKTFNLGYGLGQSGKAFGADKP